MRNTEIHQLWCNHRSALRPIDDIDGDQSQLIWHQSSIYNTIYQLAYQRQDVTLDYMVVQVGLAHGEPLMQMMGVRTSCTA